MNIGLLAIRFRGGRRWTFARFDVFIVNGINWDGRREVVVTNLEERFYTGTRLAKK